MEHCGYFLDMRMGKCLIGIRRCKRWGVTGPKLIVTPYSAFDGWQEELLNENETTALELIGTRRQRLLTCLSINNGWHIINKEGYRGLPEISKIKWSAIIIDESRFLANPKTNQSKFYTKNFQDIPHKIIMTGTPDYHHRLDFFQQLYFLNRYILPYKNYWDFRNKAFHQCGYDFVLKKKHLNILEKALSDNCVFLRRSDVNIGRKKVYIERILPLPRKFRPTYKTLEDEYVLSYKEVEAKTIYAVSTYIWMMRLCGGFVEDSFQWSGKADEIIYLLDNELRGESVVIGCRFKNEINNLHHLINTNPTLQRAGIRATITHGDISKTKRRRNVNSFRRGMFTVLIAQHSVIAHGVDLKNASAIIHYSQPSGEEIRDQFDDRIITLSDEKTVLIIDILIKDTVDFDLRKSSIEHESERQTFERTIKRRQCIL